MLHNVGVNTDIIHTRTASLKLKERNVKHAAINNIKDLSKWYDYGEVLGKGVFGTVLEVTDKTTKKIWALKVVDKTALKGKRVNTIENEIKILRMVKHPHIIYLERTFESPKHIYLILERCTGELAAILRRKRVFTEPEARVVVQHLASAVAYLHKYEIVHRDLKMENILTAPNPADSSDELFIKVSDFGLGIFKVGSRADQMLNDRCGTLTYMAPEIISHNSYSQQCDIWAMGVVTYIMLTGRYPFFSENESELAKIICNAQPRFTAYAISPEAVNLLEKMLAKNPALRVTAAEVSRHAWTLGKTMENEAPENVLDMMQMWKSEMMVQTPDLSDWGIAFKKVDNQDVISEKITSKKSKEISISESVMLEEHTKAIKPRPMYRERGERSFLARSAGALPCVSPENMLPPANTLADRAFNVKGKKTKMIQIGKVRRPTSPKIKNK